MISVFDMFKIGVGPSSSHTMGPMVAAARFLDTMRASPFEFHGLKASLHGSLAFTGVGHATDRATILGLAGFLPDTYIHEEAETALEAIRDTKSVTPKGHPTLAFDPREDLRFDFGPALPGHANGMILMATDQQGDVILQETYYSIGGGFVVTEAELNEGKATEEGDPVPYPFKSGAEMLQMAQTSGKSIADMKRANEHARGGPEAPMDISEVEEKFMTMCADMEQERAAKIWRMRTTMLDADTKFSELLDLVHPPIEATHV